MRSDSLWFFFAQRHLVVLNDHLFQKVFTGTGSYRRLFQSSSSSWWLLMNYMLYHSQEGKQLRIFLRALLQKIALHLLNWLRGASLEFSVSPQPFLAQEGRGLLWERPTPSSTWTLRGHPNSLMKPLPFYALLISNHCYGNPQAWFLGSITNPIFEGLKQTHPFNQPPTPVGVVSKFEARPCHQRSRQHWRIPWLKPNVYWFLNRF